MLMLGIKRFLSYRPKRDAIYLMQMTLMLIGCWAEQSNWRCKISLRARPDPTSASNKICWSWHEDDPQAWYKSGSLSSGPAKNYHVLIFGFCAGSMVLKFVCLPRLGQNINTSVLQQYPRAGASPLGCMGSRAPPGSPDTLFGTPRFGNI